MKRKWNILDTIVVILILILMGLIINKDRILSKAEDNAKSNQKHIVFVAEVKDLSPNDDSYMAQGDKIFSQYKIQDAEITNIEVTPHKEVYVNPQGIMQEYETNTVDIQVKIEGNVATSGPYMDLGGQEIKEGLPFILKTTKAEYLSNIKHVEIIK